MSCRAVVSKPENNHLKPKDYVEKLRPFKNRFDHQMPLKLRVILAH